MRLNTEPLFRRTDLPLSSLIPPVSSLPSLQAAAMCNSKEQGPNMPAELNAVNMEESLGRKMLCLHICTAQLQHADLLPSADSRIVLKRWQAPDEQDDVACRRGNYIK